MWVSLCWTNLLEHFVQVGFVCSYRTPWQNRADHGFRLARAFGVHSCPLPLLLAKPPPAPLPRGVLPILSNSRCAAGVRSPLALRPGVCAAIRVAGVGALKNRGVSLAKIPRPFPAAGPGLLFAPAARFAPMASTILCAIFSRSEDSEMVNGVAELVLFTPKRSSKSSGAESESLVGDGARASTNA